MTDVAFHLVDPARPPDEAWRADLLAAFWAYEKALTGNDLDGLDLWFLPGPATLRGDPSGVRVGHDEIGRFRRSRPAPGPREVDRLHVQALDADRAVLIAESHRPDGDRGMQTQVWVRTPDGWRVASAHVSTTPAS